MAKPSKSDDAKRFDPRFSPEFQPGFDARVHRESPPAVNREAASTRGRGAVITRPVSRQQDAAAAPAAGDAESTRPDDLAVSVQSAGGVSDLEVELTDREPLAWWRRLNPYLVALGAVGVGLIGLAVYWMFRVYEVATSPFTQQFDYLIMQFAMFGAPIVGGLGIAALLTILVVLAARWRS